MISRNQAGAVAECQLATQFAGVREALLNSAIASLLDTHLADWVIPADRRLPLVFMGWSLRRLVATPFEELCRTPGVGQKKIESLIQVLQRVAQAPSVARRSGNSASPTELKIADQTVVSEHNQIDYSQVSETVWAQWRQRIAEHGFGRETLGRFAPSLQRLSRVIWRTPLDVYTSWTLAELRAQKTYGEKRVRAVLEVFGTLQGVLGSAGPQPHLAVRYQPKLISRLEDWTREALSRAGRLNDEEIRRSFVEPLVQQIEIDGGDALADLARHRLGMDGPIESVLNAARRLGFMRARVYQLLNEMAAIISVRWPEGLALVKRLNEKLCPENDSAGCPAQFEATRDLFFPELRVQLLQSTVHDNSESVARVMSPPRAPALFVSGALDSSTTHTQSA